MTPSGGRYLGGGLAGDASHQGHIDHLPERRHGAVPRQAQQQVGLGVVLRDLEDHRPEAGTHGRQVLAVHEICMPGFPFQQWEQIVLGFPLGATLPFLTPTSGSYLISSIGDANLKVPSHGVFSAV